MGFIFERVPEKDLDFLKSMGLKDCWGSGLLYVDSETKWCADRERNAYLVGVVGGYGDMPHFYDFWWNGRVIRVEGEEGGKGNIKVGVDIVWIIDRIPIPKEIWNYKDEIMKMIEEAFSVNQSWCKSKYLKSISVKINCEPKIKEDK